MQLYVEGLLTNAECNTTSITSQDSQQSSGSPNSLSNLLPNDMECVEVPNNKFTPCQMAVSALQQINPIPENKDFGKQFYIQCIQIIGQYYKKIVIIVSINEF